MSDALPPRASFLGLPTEIRLSIYAHLARIISIHGSYFQECEPTWPHRLIRFVPAICNSPHTKFPQLCAQPTWSSQSPPQNLCHARAKAASPSVFACRFACKQIYAETTGVFDRDALIASTALSCNGVTLDFECRLIGVETQHLTSLTIVFARRDSMRNHEAQMDFNVSVLRRKHYLLPSLRSLAVQAIEPQEHFCIVEEPGDHVFDPERAWRKLSYVDDLYDLFQGRVTVILEAWVLLRGGGWINQNEHDEMCVILGVVWAHGEKSVHGEDSFEIKRERVVVDGKDAEWKDYWRTERMRDAEGKW